MMTRDKVIDAYFDWLYKLVCGKRYSRDISYKRLLRYLHNVEFTYLIPMDENRAEDGIDLRRRFASTDEELEYLSGPCTMLEMMVALAIRCEETIMDDASVGNRTGQWFWGMVVSLGLGAMIDSRFDNGYVNDIIERFLNRDYEPNGDGGLFTIKGIDDDLRNIEIWVQMCWYLDSII